MTTQSVLQGLLATASAMVLATISAAERPHVHGVAHLSIVEVGEVLAVEMQLTRADLPEEVNSDRLMTHVSFNEEAGCNPELDQIRTTVLGMNEDDHHGHHHDHKHDHDHDHEHHHDDHSHDHHDESGHADILVTMNWTCTRIARLDRVAFDGFPELPSVNEVQLDLLLEEGAAVATLTPDNSSYSF